jgi:hypothetical protein
MVALVENRDVASESCAIACTRLVYVEALRYIPAPVADMMISIATRDRTPVIHINKSGNKRTNIISHIFPPYDPIAIPIKKDIEQRKKSIRGCSACV